MSFKGITVAIFIIIALTMVGLFFALPFLSALPQDRVIWVCAGAGIGLFALLSSVVYALGKSSAAKASAPAGKKGKPEAAPRQEKGRIDEKAVQVLSILQKKGRLIDFLQEDISGYTDNQIGAAVRNIHKGCREAIDEYMTIAPVMKENEGSEITLSEGFDPSAIRLTGNIAGPPPFKGTLRHCGWRVSSTTLPSLPENLDRAIIEPAEVEIE